MSVHRRVKVICLWTWPGGGFLGMQSCHRDVIVSLLMNTCLVSEWQTPYHMNPVRVRTSVYEYATFAVLLLLYTMVDKCMPNLSGCVAH